MPYTSRCPFAGNSGVWWGEGGKPEGHPQTSTGAELVLAGPLGCRWGQPGGLGALPWVGLPDL